MWPVIDAVSPPKNMGPRMVFGSWMVVIVNIFNHQIADSPHEEPSHDLRNSLQFLASFFAKSSSV